MSAKLKTVSHSGLVPCLHLADGTQVWDSLAIIEFAHEHVVALGRPGAIWPTDARARALARCISAEMHGGFAELRAALPMNCKLALEGKPLSPRVQEYVTRITESWADARRRFGSPSGAGPYLFGAFSAADAMYAPVVWRFHTYNVQLADPDAAAYVKSMLADPEMQAWYAMATAEDAGVVPRYDALAVELGGPVRPTA